MHREGHNTTSSKNNQQEEKLCLNTGDKISQKSQAENWEDAETQEDRNPSRSCQGGNKL